MYPFKQLTWFAGILFLGLSFAANAQSDDRYYDPTDELFSSTTVDPIPPTVTPGTPIDPSGYSYSESPRQETVQTESKNEDSDSGTWNEYEYDDYEGAYYSSRINRFHRPVEGYNYFDPYYTDLWYYDPMNYYPGTSIYINFGSYAHYKRWSHWNHWSDDWWWDRWAYYSSPAWCPSYYSPWYYNSFGYWSGGCGWDYPYAWYDPYYHSGYYSYNQWHNHWYYNNGWCGTNYYGNNHGGNSPDVTPVNTYFGPRKGGGMNLPGTGVRHNSGSGHPTSDPGGPALPPRVKRDVPPLTPTTGGSVGGEDGITPPNTPRNPRVDIPTDSKPVPVPPRVKNNPPPVKPGTPGVPQGVRQNNEPLPPTFNGGLDPDKPVVRPDGIPQPPTNEGTEPTKRERKPSIYVPRDPDSKPHRKRNEEPQKPEVKPEKPARNWDSDHQSQPSKPKREYTPDPPRRDPPRHVDPPARKDDNSSDNKPAKSKRGG